MVWILPSIRFCWQTTFICVSVRECLPGLAGAVALIVTTLTNTTVTFSIALFFGNRVPAVSERRWRASAFFYAAAGAAALFCSPRTLPRRAALSPLAHLGCLWLV